MRGVVTAAGPLEPFPVEGESLDEVLAESLGSPDADLRATGRLHAVANRDDDVEIVVVDRPTNLTVSLGIEPSSIA